MSYPILTSDDRKARINEIKTFWASHLSVTQFSKNYVIAKLHYLPKGETEHVIRCYESELEKGDILVEYLGHNFEPLESENRILHVLPYKPNFRELYPEVSASSFQVPASDLKPFLKLKDLSTVNVPTPVPKSVSKSAPAANPHPFANFLMDHLIEEVKEEPEPEKYVNLSELPDSNFSAMTVRDLYAVFHNKPVSAKAWLNTLIKNTK
jgi:hypothetical protein